MVFARVAEYFAGSSTQSTTSSTSSTSSNTSSQSPLAPPPPSPIPALSSYQHDPTDTHARRTTSEKLAYLDIDDNVEEEIEKPHPEYRHVCQIVVLHVLNINSLRLCLLVVSVVYVVTCSCTP